MFDLEQSKSRDDKFKPLYTIPVNIIPKRLLFINGKLFVFPKDQEKGSVELIDFTKGCLSEKGYPCS